MTTIYLAYGAQGPNTLERRCDEGGPVDILVAYPELADFNKRRKRFNIGKWMLDSGAFGMWNSGLTIDVKEYIAAAKDCDADEIVGLDDPGLNINFMKRNLDAMWSAGIPAIPVFHKGEPESHLNWCLSGLCRKLGIGARGEGKKEWILQVFARVWPRCVHGFAMASWQMIRLAPFDSVDSSSWVYAPAARGHWAGYSGAQIHLKTRIIKSAKVDVWIEVLEHQRRSAWAAARWKRELKLAREASYGTRHQDRDPVPG